MSRIRNLLVPLLGIMLLAGFVAVGCQSTPEGQQQAIKKKLDELELKANKLPSAKLDIQKKVAEFKKELENAGDDLEKLKALNNRVGDYLEEVNKMADPTPATTNTNKPVGSKIGTSPANTGAPPVGGTTQPGGKLGGGTTAPPPAGGTTPPPAGGSGNSGGFGGK